MIILEKIFNVLLLIFVGFTVFIPLGNLLKIEVGMRFVQAYMLVFFFLFLLGMILAVMSVHRGYKKDKEATIKAFLKKFLLAIAVVVLINIVNNIRKKAIIPLEQGLLYSLVFPFLSYYIEERIDKRIGVKK